MNGADDGAVPMNAPQEPPELFALPIAEPPEDPSTITLGRARVGRWAERVEAAIDNEPERIDLLLDLAEDLDAVLVPA